MYIYISIFSTTTTVYLISCLSFYLFIYISLSEEEMCIYMYKIYKCNNLQLI